MRVETSVGQIFGRWAVTGPQTKRGSHWYVPVICQCGTEKVSSVVNIVRGKSKSCGCLSVEESTNRFTTHGLRKSPEYAIWNMMKQRCLVPSCKAYRYYGGRGITVCERWLTFENFYADMGKRPFAKASLERVNNEAGYYPENVIWTDKTEQMRNRRTTVRYEFQNENLTLAEWANKLGIKLATLASRIYLYKWDVQRAFTTPAGVRGTNQFKNKCYA